MDATKKSDEGKKPSENDQKPKEKDDNKKEKSDKKKPIKMNPQTSELAQQVLAELPNFFIDAYEEKLTDEEKKQFEPKDVKKPLLKMLEKYDEIIKKQHNIDKIQEVTDFMKKHEKSFKPNQDAIHDFKRTTLVSDGAYLTQYEAFHRHMHDHAKHREENDYGGQLLHESGQLKPPSYYEVAPLNPNFLGHDQDQPKDYYGTDFRKTQKNFAVQNYDNRLRDAYSYADSKLGSSSQYQQQQQPSNATNNRTPQPFARHFIEQKQNFLDVNVNTRTYLNQDIAFTRQYPNQVSAPRPWNTINLQQPQQYPY